MDMELHGVHAVNDRILRCHRLRAYVLAHDRTPLTDGHIDVYSDDTNAKNTNFQHRVNVQVKGRGIKAGKNPPKSFSVEAADLRGLLELRGVLYFVVSINKKSLNASVMYAQLTPFKIQSLLKNVPASGNVSIRLEPFPQEPAGIEKVVRFAAKAQSEDPQAQIDISLLKDPVSITLHSDKDLDLSSPLTLTRDTTNYSVSYEFADGSRIFVDHELRIIPGEYQAIPSDIHVEAGAFEYTNPSLKKTDTITVEVTLSKGVTMTLSTDDSGLKSPGSINVSMRPTLKERLHDLSFFFTCLDDQSLRINGTLHKMHLTANEDTGDLRKHLHFLETIATLCEHLGVDTGLVDLKSLESRRGDQLLALEGVMLHNDEISSEHQRIGRIAQPIGEWSIQLMALEDQSSNKWRLHGVFDPDRPGHLVSQSTEPNGVPVVVTAYDVLEYKYLPFTLNLRLENLVAAYQEVSSHEGTDDRATDTVLNLIRAADDVPLRREEFLTAASELNTWLISKYGQQPTCLINGWQITARTGNLSKLDEDSIRKLKHQAARDESERSTVIQVACAILLQDSGERDYCLSLLDAPSATLFRTWPIWRLSEASTSIHQ